MHTYEPITVSDPADIPSICGKTFHDAFDVVEFERISNLVAWRTWPEVWHLDDTGEMRCYHKASSLDSIREWADDPRTLLLAREQGLRNGGCADRWVIIESRTAMWHGEGIVSEADAKAFLDLRALLSRHGIELLDAVIFDDANHWWSMHELTSAGTRWPGSADGAP